MPSVGASQWVLEHCCRSGKTWLAMRYLLGDRFSGGPPQDLRPHQRRALQELVGLDAGIPPPNAKTLMVFSSLAVLQQFVDKYLVAPLQAGWLSTADLGSVVALCSASDHVKRPWYNVLPGRTDDPFQEQIQDILRDSGFTLFLSTYESCHRLNTALDVTDTALDRTVFDEAHNVHTPSRFFLWGGSATEQDDGAASAAGESVAESEALSSEDSTHAASLVPTTEGVDLLNRRYPSRLYMTATPRPVMRHYEDVYGDCQDPSTWHTFRYSDLLQDQKDCGMYAQPCVKEFDITVLFNGHQISGAVQEDERPKEFWDRVSFLRTVLAGGRNGPTAVKRALLFHAYAYHTERAAAVFGEQEAWRDALTWLQNDELSSGFDALGWDLDKDFAIYSVVGGEGNVTTTLDRFNSADDGKVHVLCSCQALKEGVTLRSCDLVCYADGKSSQRDIVQSALRGIQYDPLRPECRLKILLLVGVDGSDVDVEDDAPTASAKIQECLRQGNGMESLATVLAALQTQDPSLAEDLLALAAEAPAQREVAKQESGTLTGQDNGASSPPSSDCANLDEILSSPPQEADNTVAGAIDEMQRPLRAAGTWQDADIIVQDSTAVPMDANTLHHYEETQETSGHSGDGPAFIPDAPLPPKKKRLTMKMDPNLFRWKYASEDLCRLEEGLAEQVADIAIQMALPIVTQKELVRLKVDCFCRLWPGDTAPKQGEKKPIPREWLPPRSPHDANPMDGGVFWSSIRLNFVGNGSGAHTHLDEPERAKIRALPWSAAAIKSLEETRQKRAEHYLSTWKEKVDWFCRLWPGDRLPKQRGMKPIPREWLPPGAQYDAAPMDGGIFWANIRLNFVGDGSGGTHLDESECARIRALPWAAEAIKRLRATREKRAQHYQPTSVEKVDWFCRLWPGDTMPKQREKNPIPREWLPHGAQYDAAPMDGGMFWNKVKENFLGNGSSAHTHLNKPERTKICALPWSSEAIKSLEATQEQRAQHYQPTLKERVDLFCRLWSGKTKPKQGEKKLIPREWLPPGAQLDATPMDGGMFWKHIRGNFVGDGSRSNTHLKEPERAKIHALPWFPAALDRLQKFRKNKRLRHRGAHSSPPPKRDKKAPVSGATSSTDVPPASPASSSAATLYLPAPASQTAPPCRKRSRNTEEAKIKEPKTKKLRCPSEIQAEAETLCRNMQEDVERQRRNGEATGLHGSVTGAAGVTAPGFNAGAFDQLHHAFKDYVNAELCELAPATGPILYLDHWADDTAKTSLRTTEAMLKHFSPTQLFCVNPNGAIVNRLRQYGVHAQQGTLADVVGSERTRTCEDRAFQGRGVPVFGAVYLDLCTAAANEVLNNLELLKDQLAPEALLCYTMTGRDWNGKTMVHRCFSIHEYLESHDFHFSRGSHARSVFEFRSPSTSVMSCFYSRTPL